jgi:hypothetical protein
VPPKDVLTAAAGVLDSMRELYRALGPIWGCVVTVLFLATGIALYVLRARHLTQGWHAALLAKDDMIRQINEQNRELRLQGLVMGGAFSKEEASALIYGNRHLLVDRNIEPAKKEGKT